MRFLKNFLHTFERAYDSIFHNEIVYSAGEVNIDYKRAKEHKRRVLLGEDSIIYLELAYKDRIIKPRDRQDYINWLRSSACRV